MNALSVQDMSRHITLPFAQGASTQAIGLQAGGNALQAQINPYDFTEYQARFNQWPRPSYVLVAQKDINAAIQVTIDYVSRSSSTPQGSISLTVPAGALAGTSFVNWQQADGTPARALLANPDLLLTTLHMSSAAPDGECANWWSLVALLGDLARLFWVIGNERDVIRRQMQLVQAQRYLPQAVRYSLDLLGHDLGVPRFPPRPYSFDGDTLALYHLDDQFVDNQGSIKDSMTDYALPGKPGHPGQRTGVTSVPGRFGPAIALRNPGAIIVIPDTTQTFALPATQSFTLECLLKPDSGTPDGEVLAKIPAGSGTVAPAGWSLSVGAFQRGISLNVRFLLSDGTQQLELFADQPLPTNSFSHVAGVIDRQANVAYLYLNGKVVRTQTIVGLGALTNTEPIRIGSTATAAYRGCVDEVRFSQTARTAFNPVLGEADEAYRQRLALFTRWTLPTLPNLTAMLNQSVGPIQGVPGPSPIVLDDIDAPTVSNALSLVVQPEVPDLFPPPDPSATILVLQSGGSQPANGFTLSVGDTINLGTQPTPNQQQNVSWLIVSCGAGQANFLSATNGPTASLVATLPGSLNLKVELATNQNIVAGTAALRILPRPADLPIGATIGSDGTLGVTPDIAGNPDPFFHPVYLLTHSSPQATYGGNLNNQRMQLSVARLLDKLLALLASKNIAGPLEIVQAYTPDADDSTVENRLSQVGRALTLHHPTLTGDRLAVLAHTVGFTYVSHQANEQVLVLQKPGPLIAVSGPQTVAEGQSITMTVTPQASPAGLAASSSTVYIANNGTDSLSIVDSATGKIRTALKIGWGPVALALSPDGKRLYSADSLGNTITVMDVDVATGNVQIVRQLPVQKKPVALAHHPVANTQLLYVLCQDDNSLQVIDTSALSVVGSLTVGASPDSIVLTPDGKAAWIALSGGSAIAIVSTSPLQATGSIPLTDAPFKIALTPDGARAYVTQPTSNRIAVLDVPGQKLLATQSLNSRPGGVAADSSNVYVTSRERKCLYLLQPDGTTSRWINLGQEVDDVIVASGHTYIVSNQSNVVSLLDAQGHQVIAAWQPGTGLGEYLTWEAIQGQSTEVTLNNLSASTVQVTGEHAGPALIKAVYVLPGNTPPYTFDVRLQDTSNAPIIRKDQYDLIMNILNVFHPVGVEVTTQSIRQYVIEVRGQLIDLVPSYTYPNFRMSSPLP